MEKVHIQPLVSGDLIKAFVVGVLRRRAWLDTQHSYPVLVSPFNQRSAEKLRGVVTANRSRFFSYSVTRARDRLPWRSVGTVVVR